MKNSKNSPITPSTAAHSPVAMVRIVSSRELGRQFAADSPRVFGAVIILQLRLFRLEFVLGIVVLFLALQLEGTGPVFQLFPEEEGAWGERASSSSSAAASSVLPPSGRKGMQLFQRDRDDLCGLAR